MVCGTAPGGLNLLVIPHATMRLPFMVAAADFAAGVMLWAVAALTEVGSVTGESSDSSQRARITVDVPAWVGVAKTLGITMMALAAVGAGGLRVLCK